MATTTNNEVRKITRGFQITLPKFFREKNNLSVGDLVEVVRDGSNFLLKSFKKEEGKEKALESLVNILDEPTSNDFRGKDEKDIIDLIDKERRGKL